MFSGAIARSTLRTSGVLGVRLIVQAGTLVAVARLLGPENYGAFAGLTALAVLMGTFSTLGMHLMVLSEVACHPEREEEVLSYALPATLLCGSCLFCIYLFGSVSAFSGSNVAPFSIALFGLAELIVQPLLSISSSQHMAREKVSMSQVVMILPLGLRLLAVAAIAAFDVSNVLAVYSVFYLVSSLVALIFALFILPERWPSVSKFRAPSRSELKVSLGYGALNVTAAGPGELDKVLVAHLVSSVGAGLYSAATRVIGAATLPVLALMFSVMPRLFRSANKIDENAPSLHRLLLLTCLGYGVVLCIAFGLLADWLDILFGRHYSGLGAVLLWLLPAIPALVLRMAAGNILMTAGQTWKRAGFELAGILALVAGAAVFAPRFGVGGMAIALGCAEWLMALIGVTLVLRLSQRTI